MATKKRTTKKAPNRASKGASNGSAPPPERPKKHLFTSEFDAESGILTLQFEGMQPAAFAISNQPLAFNLAAAAYGIVRRIENAADRVETVKQMLAGTWPGRVTRGAKGAGRVPITVEALARATGQPVEKCLERWKAASEAERDGIKGDWRIKAHASEIRAERARERAGDAPAGSSLVDALMGAGEAPSEPQAPAEVASPPPAAAPQAPQLPQAPERQADRGSAPPSPWGQ